jgi:hypothetical protein
MDAQLRPTDSATLPHPYTFADRMRTHWTTSKPVGLGNVPSAALSRLWVTMGETFNKAIAGNPSTVNPFRDVGELEAKWHVLSPPCGAGKTQGLRVYAAMLAKANLTLPTDQKVGTLIVVREIETADDLAHQINETFARSVNREIGGRSSKEENGALEVHHPINSPALARHSKARSTAEEIRAAQTLVITQAAYVQALDRLTEDVCDRWSTLIEWEHGQRRFVCVDESLSNLVEDYQLTLDGLRSTVGNIPSDIVDHHPGQIKLLNGAVEVLRWVRSLAKGLKATDPDEDEDGMSTPNTSDRAVWDATTQRDPEAAAKWTEASKFADMSGLRRAVSAHRKRGEAKVIERNGNLSAYRLESSVMDMTLKSVQAICSRHAWYSRKGKFDTLNSSRLLLPDPFPVHVCALDATAGQEVTWELLDKERVHQPETPKDARSYSNVTLHVSRVKGGLGKTRMAVKGKARLARVIEHLNSTFAGQKDRKVFLACHMDVEHHAKGHVLSFGNLSTAHWNAIDGKNLWADHSVAVIVGLPYRSRICANNLYQAINGKQDTAWLQSNAAVRARLEVKQLTTAICQAINRVHCRATVDDKGNCKPTDVYLFLKEGDEGHAILVGLREEMPGVVVEGWDFDLDGPRATIRRGSSHDALITFAENAPAEGKWHMGWIERELGLTPSASKDLRKVLNDRSSPLAKALADLGARYVSDGAGRGARSFLVKVAKAVMPKAA